MTIDYKEKTYENWKEYLLARFPRELFDIELINKDDTYLENYRITLIENTSKTEIIFKILIKPDNYQKLFDVYFNHPDSPVLTRENKENKYGFDQTVDFTIEELRNMDEWIDIPVFHGWQEETTLLF